MKKLVLTLAVALMALCASANNYVANDAAIDALVENSVEMVMEAAAPVAPANMIQLSNNADPLVATLLSWVTGWCGLHRYYLGTQVWMAAPYLVTCGVLGWIDAVIFTIEYIQDGKISKKYYNNPKVILWADLF